MVDTLTILRELVLLLLVALTVILITRRLAVPYTLGLVVVGLLIGVLGLVPEIRLTPDLVLFVFLPALLFEGAWSMSLDGLRENWRVVMLLAVPGMLLELVLIGLPLHFLGALSWPSAFLLAAILSPTDPVAVLGLFRQLKVNQSLSTIIEAESLFNDGVAGVLYQVFLALVLLGVSGQHLSVGQIWLNGLGVLALEAGGGVAIGAACGYLVSRWVKFIDEPLIETTITIVAAYGVYLLADTLHMSGILAVIVVGLFLASYSRSHSMSERTREVVDNYWTMSAFLVNALLFLLVGAQFNPVQFFSSPAVFTLALTAIVAILAVLLARFMMVLLLPRSIPAFSVRLRAWRFIIFWSGLRGALSMALVLALPLGVPDRNILVFATYAVVFFTLLVQGFSLRSILMRLPSTQQQESVE
jgi:CPA1 family monovalent cation:H+ antiporter